MRNGVVWQGKNLGSAEADEAEELLLCKRVFLACRTDEEGDEETAGWEGEKVAPPQPREECERVTRDSGPQGTTQNSSEGGGDL